MAAFKIGINMAGAVSAGAYTAGVLDFLTEALDEWYKAKARGEAVPAHDVSIEVFTGASAGGMCAAISALMLQQEFEHIHDTSVTGTTNTLYESWVNKIDIRELLKTDDLKKSSTVISLLDSTIITKIASDALTPAAPLPEPRPYVSPNLTLFLSLTNLRGVPYSLNGAAPGSIEETTLFFGDRIRFETLRPDKTQPPSPRALTLDATKPDAAGGWDVLQSAAAATGAFPMFLAPRTLQRKRPDYCPPIWESISSSSTTAPNFPEGLADPMDTLNVDGGITNNDPFNFAHDYVCGLLPPSEKPDESAENADRAVITIAPFPTLDKFEAEFSIARQSSIFAAFSRLFSALVTQSRFFGESLSQIMNGTTFSRFIIAPSDLDMAEKSPSEPALQCAALGAFGGFFERKFRAHDFELGRRNCQKFLQDFFVLPEDNVVMQPALQSLSSDVLKEVKARFQRPAPGSYIDPAPRASDLDGRVWMPIVPLCSDVVSQEMRPIPRHKMTAAELNEVMHLILVRFGAVITTLLDNVKFLPLRWFLKLGQPVIRLLMRKPLKESLVKGLGNSYQP
jgi:hypothetical protein